MSLQQGGEYKIEVLPAGDFIVTGICYNQPDGGTAKKMDIQKSSYEAHLEPGVSMKLDIELR